MNKKDPHETVAPLTAAELEDIRRLAISLLKRISKIEGYDIKITKTPIRPGR